MARPRPAFHLRVCACPEDWFPSSIPVHPSALRCPAGSGTTQVVELQLAKTAAKFHKIFQNASIIKPHGFQ